MCGVVGIVSKSEVSPIIYDALTILQHRGQDAAGIATSTNNRFFIRKQLGLVRDVIRNQHIVNLRGQMGIGHVRYPTAGSEDRELAQNIVLDTNDLFMYNRHSNAIGWIIDLKHLMNKVHQL